MYDLFHWVGTTAIGVAMRDSTWGFAIVETLHLVALAILGGGILVVDLAALKLLFRRQDAADIARALAPILVAALATMLVSGALLVSSKPIRYYLDDIFRAKMALLLLATIGAFVVDRLLRRRIARPILVRIAAAVSLTLWLGVGICGRLIGFL